MNLTSRGDGRVWVTDMGGMDRGFGHARLGVQLAITEQFGVFAEASSRFTYSEGNQAGYLLGMNWQF